MSTGEIDRRRAEFAYRFLEHFVEAEGDSSEQTDSCGKLRPLRSVMLSAPVMIRSHGLVLSLAFWLSKDRDAEKETAEAIIKWLQKSPLSKDVCPWKAGDGALPVLGKLIGESRAGVMDLLEREAEEIAAWLKRAVEGRWVSGGCSKTAGTTAER